MSETERELLKRIDREMLREVVASVLAEERALEAARQELAAQREAEELTSIRRKYLTPKQVSELVDRIGKDAYLALKYSDDDDQPRDGAGRYRRR